MLTRDKRINELEAQLEHLQARVDNLRDNLENLEKFFKHRVGGFIDDRLGKLEDYLNIEFVVEPERGRYVKKEGKR